MATIKAARRAARQTRDWVEDRVSHGQHVIYFHVPKCGGRSVRAALRSSFSVGRMGVVELDPRASKQAADALGELALDYRERWLLYHVAIGRAHLIAGHFGYSPYIERLQNHEWTTLTVLREPTAHLYSQFFYNRDKSDQSHVHVERGTAIKDFLRTEAAREIGLSYVEHFTDPKFRHVADSDEAIESAMENLAKIDAVGTLERLDDWVDQVATLTGRRLKIGQSNTNPTSRDAQAAEIDDEVREMVNEICRPNRILYKRLFGDARASDPA